MQAFGEPDEIRLAELLPCFDRYVCQNGKSRLKEPLADCFCLLAIARPEFLADVQGEENGSAGISIISIASLAVASRWRGKVDR